jgi:predicted nucleic acid-binding protein
LKYLLDTSAMYASLVRDDQHRAAARAFFRTPNLQLVTTSIVVGEMYTLMNQRHGYAAANALRDLLVPAARITVHHLDIAEEARIWDTLRRHAGIPLSYADASLVVLGQLLAIDTVFSFDDDFRRAGLKTVPA